MKIKWKLGLLAQVSLFYNGLILFAVAMNYEWVKTRAAGCQFEEFPISIRVAYLLMFSGTIFLMFFLYDLLNGSPSERALRAARYLGYLFILSTAMQVISPSADERFNAVPAAIISYTFLLIGRNKLNK